MMIGTVLAFAAVLGGGGIQAQPAPVAPATPALALFNTSEVPVIPTGPVGRWAPYGEGTDSCAVTRNYGTAQKPVILSIQPAIDQKSLTFFVVTPAAGSPQSWGKGAVITAPGKSVTVDYRSSEIDERGQHFDIFAIGRSDLDGLEAAGTLTIRASSVTTIPASDALDAVRVMDRCQAALFASWGIDPARFGYGKPAPALRGNPGSWFPFDAYPPDARRAHEQGRVVVVLEVGSDGLVKDCHVAVSVSPSLDTTTCRIALLRGRFAPVRDTAGNPATTWAIVPVRWAMAE